MCFFVFNTYSSQGMFDAKAKVNFQGAVFHIDFFFHVVCFLFSFMLGVFFFLLLLYYMLSFQLYSRIFFLTLHSYSD